MRRLRKRRKSHYHTGVHSSPKAGECKYRSSWEQKFMQFLDDNVDVLSYGYESVLIVYVSNAKTGRLRRYIPDFFVQYVDGRQELIEIKPEKRMNTRIVKKKAEVARLWCADHGATYVMMGESVLKGLGVL